MLPPTTTITTTTTTTTTTVENKCTTCGATCYKIVHQVTTYFPDPHACRCWGYAAGGPSSAGNICARPPQVHHHHRQDIFALPDGYNTRRVIAPDPNPSVRQLWLPDYYQIMQQLKEFEPLSDEVLALRLQLEEYMAIAKSKKDSAGRNWLYIPLPENIKNILVMARDVLNSLIGISTPPKARVD